MVPAGEEGGSGAETQARNLPIFCRLPYNKQLQHSPIDDKRTSLWILCGRVASGRQSWSPRSTPMGLLPPTARPASMACSGSCAAASATCTATLGSRRASVTRSCSRALPATWCWKAAMSLWCVQHVFPSYLPVCRQPRQTHLPGRLSFKRSHIQLVSVSWPASVCPCWHMRYPQLDPLSGIKAVHRACRDRMQTVWHKMAPWQ